MYKVFIVLIILAGLPFVGYSEVASTQNCRVEKASPDVSKSIQAWLEDTEFDRRWHGREKLRAMLENPTSSCRDVIELQQAFYLLDLRDRDSDTAIESAEYIFANSDDYEAKQRREAIQFLVRAYKQHRRYNDLVSLAQQDIVTADPFTFIPARDGFVLSSFALRGAVETLEMLRPLANAPVNTKDWWLMHFAHALAEREGARELADQFLAKAESLYVPKRPLEFPTELEGDKADKMLALSTLSEPDRANLWQIVKPPKPDYPSAALNKLESGACAVVFDISPSGATENVRAYCSSKRFLKEAARAIDDVRFESSAENPRPAQGIIYPLEFTIHG